MNDRVEISCGSGSVKVRHEARKVVVHGRPPDQLAGKPRQGGRGLDAIAALPRQPEEAFGRAVETGDRGAVGGKAAQPGPARLDPGHRKIHRLLEPVKPFGKHHVVDEGVMRLDRILVVRRNLQAPGIGLGVPALG